MDLTQRRLERIAKVDATLKSYATITADQAIATARVADEKIRAGRNRGPLHGVPVAVKDLCYTKGVRTMGGTPVRKISSPPSMARWCRNCAAPARWCSAS